MSLDPAFYQLRQKPLPTLQERRRLVSERLAKTQAEIDRLIREPYSPKQAVKIGALLADEDLLIKALAYLGEPDLRLDLYRLFGMDLPKAE